MTPEFARAVDPVFLQVIGLLDRIASQESLNPEEEQVRIIARLDRAQAILGERADWVLAKYALVAWIDDVLIDAPWPERDWWTEHRLEFRQFRSALAYEQFYTKAQEASSLPKKDSLEVFYVCVMLGFRGLYRDQAMAGGRAQELGLPADLDTWASRTAMGIHLGQGRPPIVESGRTRVGAPPLKGRERMILSLVAGAVLFTAVIIGLMFLSFQ